MTLQERLTYWKRILTREEMYISRQIKLPVRWAGEPFAGFFVAPGLIPEKGIVYSFGVGTNISFDLEMIKNHGASVYAFDPTPRSIEFIEQSQLPKSFHFIPVGIDREDGHTFFFLPEDPSHVSCSTHNRWDESANNRKIKVPVKRFSTLARELGHTKIDVLKIDIEGSEYGIMDDVLSSGVEITQLLVEVHHRFNGIGIQKTKDLIAQINKAGYKIAAISGSREEYTFVKP